MTIRAKQALLLAQAEGSGIDPDASVNAILVRDPSIQPNTQTETPNEATGSLDSEGPVTGGTRVQVTFSVHVKGSGDAATPPEWGVLMPACAWEQVITSTALPVAPEACAAGGSTTSAVLGTSAVADAQAYRGMPLALSGDIDATTFITDYTAAKTATLAETMASAVGIATNWQIPPHVLYRPVTPVGNPGVQLWLYMHGRRWRLRHAVGTGEVSLNAGSATGGIQFTFDALYEGDDEAQPPADPVFDATRPYPWKGGVMTIDRARAGLQSFSLTWGVTTEMPANPNSAEGFDAGVIVSRAMTGSMDPNTVLKGTRDLFDRLRAGSRVPLHAVLGQDAGNRIALTVPSAHLTGYTPAERNGVATEDVQFSAAGADAGAFIALF